MSYDKKTLKRTLPSAGRVNEKDRDKLSRAEADGWALYDVQGDEYRLRRPTDHTPPEADTPEQEPNEVDNG